MKKLVKQVVLGAVGVCVLATVSAGAAGLPLTVGEQVTVNNSATSVNPIGDVYINDAATAAYTGQPLGNNSWLEVEAGIYLQQITAPAIGSPGATTYYSVKSFCIDPFHIDGGGLDTYTVGLLSTDNSHGMTVVPNGGAAAEVNRLLSYYYKANMTAQQAVDLQVAIWDVVGEDSSGEGWQGLVENSSKGVYVFAGGLTFSQYEAAAANSSPWDHLVLTDNSQNYVLVPDGGATTVLLGMALAGLGVLRRKA
jgi:hypothetical protein